MEIQSPVNNCLVQIEKRYQDKNGQIKIDTTWRPEEFATLEGIVHSAPTRVENDQHRTVIGSLKKGDKIIFSYSIVYDYESQPDDDTPVYKNLIIYNGEEYWKVDMGEIFCKLGLDNSIEMITDHVLLEMFPVENIAFSEVGLVLPGQNTDHLGIVKAVPENINLSVRVGDTVCFEPRFAQKYNILGREHIVIPARRVLSKL